MVVVAIHPEFKRLRQHFKARVVHPLKPKQSLIALCGKLIRILFTIVMRRLAPPGPVRLNGLNR